MKDNKSKVVGALKRIKDKTIDVASDVLSAPKVAFYKVREKDANEQRNIIVANRRAKDAAAQGALPKVNNETDPIFRARVNALNNAFDREHERLKK